MPLIFFADDYFLSIAIDAAAAAAFAIFSFYCFHALLMLMPMPCLLSDSIVAEG